MLTKSARAVALAAAPLLVGCATTFAGPDIERVRALTRVDALPRLGSADSDQAVSQEVRTLVERPMDVDAAVRIALLNNRELRATVHEMGIARGRYVQATLLPNPVVETERPIEPEIRYEAGVEYDLTHALLTPLRARAARTEVDAARYRTARAVIDVGFAARSAFHSAQAAAQRLAVARRTLDALAAGRDAARALLEAGNVPALTVASQEAAYERARALVSQLELEVAATREALNRTLGLHGTQTSWQLAGVLSPVPDQHVIATDLESKVLAASSELAETRSRLDGVARRTGVARAEGWIPDVAVVVRAGEVKHDAGAHAERRWAGGLQLSVPLFNRNQGTTHALGAEFDGLLERYQGAAIDARSASREARNRLVSAHARARQYETVILPAQRKVTQQTLLQFNAMQVGVFQLLVARRDELEVELAYIDTLREYWISAAALDALVAGGRPSLATSSGVRISNQSQPEGGH